MYKGASMTDQTKECKCARHVGNRLLPISQFYKNKNYNDGYHGSCKACNKLEQMATYDGRPGEQQQAQRDSYYRNREARLKRAHELYHERRNDIDVLVYKMFHNARARAAKKHLEFSISLSDIIIPEYCPVFDIKLQQGTGVASDNSPTLDRIDSTKGYTKDNIHVISKRANTIKNAGTPEEHQRIYEYFSRSTKPQ